MVAAVALRAEPPQCDAFGRNYGAKSDVNRPCTTDSSPTDALLYRPAAPLHHRRRRRRRHRRRHSRRHFLHTLAFFLRISATFRNIQLRHLLCGGENGRRRLVEMKVAFSEHTS